VRTVGRNEVSSPHPIWGALSRSQRDGDTVVVLGEVRHFGTESQVGSQCQSPAAQDGFESVLGDGGGSLGGVLEAGLLGVGRPRLLGQPGAGKAFHPGPARRPMSLGGAGGKLDSCGTKQLQRPRGIADRAGMRRAGCMLFHQDDGHRQPGEEHRGRQAHQAAADHQNRNRLDVVCSHQPTKSQLDQ
jgi:hypothetical protein